MYFTICIPTYNRANTIGRTLKSLKRQTFQDFEVIVVDDGSTDDTKSLIMKWENQLPCKYIYKENGGKHTALNVGIENASGAFFMILDSDDWLEDTGLEILYNLCRKIESNDRYSGVLARCVENRTGKIIGAMIPEGVTSFSYIDMHFSFAYRMELSDCCECNKTVLIKQYRFPEQPGMKFVPEAWMFDQVGMQYKLLCTNEVVKRCEYLEDGITLDKNFKIKNNIGYLYHYVSRIENIIPNINASFKIKLVAWWRYWQAVAIDEAKKGPRVRKITLFGYIVSCIMPIINFAYKLQYRKYCKTGR